MSAHTAGQIRPDIWDYTIQPFSVEYRKKYPLLGGRGEKWKGEESREIRDYRLGSEDRDQ